MIDNGIYDTVGNTWELENQWAVVCMIWIWLMNSEDLDLYNGISTKIWMLGLWATLCFSAKLKSKYISELSCKLSTLHHTNTAAEGCGNRLIHQSWKLLKNETIDAHHAESSEWRLALVMSTAMLPPENVWKYQYAYLSTLVQSDRDIRSSKVGAGNRCFSIPHLKVGWNILTLHIVSIATGLMWWFATVLQLAAYANRRLLADCHVVRTWALICRRIMAKMWKNCTSTQMQRRRTRTWEPSTSIHSLSSRTSCWSRRTVDVACWMRSLNFWTQVDSSSVQESLLRILANCDGWLLYYVVFFCCRN